MNLKVILLIWAMINSAWHNMDKLETIKQIYEVDKVSDTHRSSVLDFHDLTDDYNLLNNGISINNVSVDVQTGVVLSLDGYVTYFFAMMRPDKRAFICSYKDTEVYFTFYDDEFVFLGGGSEMVCGTVKLEVPTDAAYITVSYESVDTDEKSPVFLVQEDNENVFVVSKTDGENSSVRKAVNSVPEGEKALILVFEGIYEENIKAWGKNILLFGTDREDCVISYKTSNYHVPPLEISCGGVYNMTIQATGGPNEDKPGAYGVHVEDNSLYENDLVFYNCDILSKSNSAIGMGMRGGCRVLIEDCTLAGYETGLFCHDGAYVKYTGVQNLTLRNSVIEGRSGRMAMRFDSQGVSGARINVTFVNSLLVNKNTRSEEELLYVQNNGGRGEAANWMGLKNYFITPESFGNLQESLNYK